jgi:hypothetical protein
MADEHEQIPWTGNQAYNKNLRVQMGRCPVRSIFEKVMPLSEALEGYDLFDKMKVQKVVFELGQ